MFPRLRKRRTGELQLRFFLDAHWLCMSRKTTPTSVSQTLSCAHSPSQEGLSDSCLKVKRREAKLESQRFREKRGRVVTFPGNRTSSWRGQGRVLGNTQRTSKEGGYGGVSRNMRAEGEPAEEERLFPGPEPCMRHVAIAGLWGLFQFPSAFLWFSQTA